jgi:hypothetical protein
MSAASSADQVWHDFMEQPGSYIHPERLARCFRGLVAAELCAKLASSERLRSRLAEMIRLYYMLPPAVQADEGADEQDLIIAMAPPEILQSIVPSAGAIYWSAAIANTVLAAEVAALQEQIGENLCAVAVKNRDLAGPASSLSSLDTLTDRIMASGWLCLAAWCESLHPAIAARVRLKLPPHALFDAPMAEDYRAIGPDIIRRVAMEAE